MTDNEIIKALECCKDLKCSECPKKTNLFKTDCDVKLCQEAIDLINRQKAEIERLQKENEFHRKTITENAQRALEVLVDEIDKAKIEAIKEFAERLKATFTKAINGIPINSKGFSLRGEILHDAHMIIDHVKKEMVGDDNATH